jgi:hypothetical protein
MVRKGSLFVNPVFFSAHGVPVLCDGFSRTMFVTVCGSAKGSFGPDLPS